MNHVTLYIATSVDGYIARPDGDVSWLDAFQGDDLEADYERFLASVDALVMGARTYEQVRSFGGWPYEGKRSYVLSHGRLEAPPGADVQFHAGGPADLMQRIRTFTEGHVWLVGGATVVTGFLKAGLVDEIRLAVVPVILGEGLRLFTRQAEAPLEFVASRPFESGIVELTYRVGGTTHRR